jgi:hypothetical protein
LVVDEDSMDAEIPLPDCDGVVENSVVEEDSIDESELTEQGGSGPVYSSQYSSFLLPLLTSGSLKNGRSGNNGGVFIYEDFYQLVSGFEAPSVADQLRALGNEKNFARATSELQFMARYMWPAENQAAKELVHEFLNFLGETQTVPCSGCLGFGFVLYCDALKQSREQPRYRAASEVFYSTPTSEAPCERVIGAVRAIIGDDRYNLALKTLTGMLALRNKFDERKLVLRK